MGNPGHLELPGIGYSIFDGQWDLNEVAFIPFAERWDLPGTWELGIGAPIGLNDKSDNYRIITQLIYEFDI